MTNQPPSHAEWIALVREGCSGNTSSFQLRLSRLIARLRREKSPLSDVLSKGLAEATSSRMSLARDALSQQGMLSPVDTDSNLPLTSIQFPAILQHRPIWQPEVKFGLESLLKEWSNSSLLIQAGLEPSRTLLLSGPPGVGKTMAATYIAEQLNLPLVTLNLATAVNSLLGKTGNNLAKVLRYAQSQPCVLLLDEFDAFAKRRDDNQDIGELKRVVNVLLQAIDEWPATSLLVAATNHEELLDKAIFRRFDYWLQFPESNEKQVAELLVQLGCDFHLAKKLSSILAGRPLSDTYKLVVRAKRQVVLEGISFEKAICSIAMPEIFQQDEIQRYFEIKKLRNEGKSFRTIGNILGIHASTVSRILRKSE